MIYNKHLTEFAAPLAKKREVDMQAERAVEERRRVMTHQMIEQQRMAQNEVMNNYKGVLQGQIAQHENIKMSVQQERAA